MGKPKDEIVPVTNRRRFDENDQEIGPCDKLKADCAWFNVGSSDCTHEPCRLRNARINRRGQDEAGLS